MLTHIGREGKKHWQWLMLHDPRVMLAMWQGRLRVVIGSRSDGYPRKKEVGGLLKTEHTIPPTKRTHLPPS